MRIDGKDRNALVEDALHTYPVAEPPPGLAAAVRKRVLATRPARFRLTWVDLALGLSFSSLLGGFWLLLGALPPRMLEMVRLRLLICWQQMQVRGLDSLLFSLGALLLVPVIAGLVWMVWPRRLVRWRVND